MTWLLVIFYCTVEVFSLTLPTEEVCESVRAVVAKDIERSGELWEDTRNFLFYKGKCVRNEEYPVSPPACVEVGYLKED